VEVAACHASQVWDAPRVGSSLLILTSFGASCLTSMGSRSLAKRTLAWQGPPVLLLLPMNLQVDQVSIHRA